MVAPMPQPGAVRVILTETRLQIIDQAEINDIDGNLGIVAGFQSFPEKFFIRGAGWLRGSFGGCGFYSKRVGVLRVDAVKAALSVNGV